MGETKVTEVEEVKGVDTQEAQEEDVKSIDKEVV